MLILLLNFLKYAAINVTSFDRYILYCMNFDRENWKMLLNYQMLLNRDILCKRYVDYCYIFSKKYCDVLALKSVK